MPNLEMVAGATEVAIIISSSASGQSSGSPPRYPGLLTDCKKDFSKFYFKQGLTSPIQ